MTKRKDIVIASYTCLCEKVVFDPLPTLQRLTLSKFIYDKVNSLLFGLVPNAQQNSDFYFPTGFCLCMYC